MTDLTTVQPEGTGPSGPSRRSLVAGAAWAVPAIAIASAAPAMAISTPPGLQGWVTISRSGGDGNCTLEIDGVGNYAVRGLWVFNTTNATGVTGAFIVFYYPMSLGILTWSAATDNSGWSAPAYDAGDDTVAGHYAYKTTYSGSWTFVNGTPTYTLANGDPHFTSSSATCPNRNIDVYARRTVTVDGSTISFLRGPVNI